MQKYQLSANHRSIEQFNRSLEYVGDETHQIKQLTEKLQTETFAKITELSKLWSDRTDNLDSIIEYVDKAKKVFEQGSEGIQKFMQEENLSFSTLKVETDHKLKMLEIQIESLDKKDYEL